MVKVALLRVITIFKHGQITLKVAAIGIALKTMVVLAKMHLQTGRILQVILGIMSLMSSPDVLTPSMMAMFSPFQSPLIIP